jgi:hyperosmotically inducible periplasmic protein
MLESDLGIEASFRNSHVYTTYLKDDRIAVRSDSGIVTLTGTVANASHRPMAAYTAEALPGVREVDNRIKVTGPAEGENIDAWIRSKIVTVLASHRSVSAGETDVEVENGVVTLRGVASSDAQRALTVEYAADIQGVTVVKNEMTVADDGSGPERTGMELIDDASVTAKSKMALLLHRSTSGLHTTVEVSEGVVTLGGEARNDAEKDLASKLVADIKGVNRVVNEMSIDKTAYTSNQAPTPER